MSIERWGIELPVVQAGMGGLSTHALAAAVAEAGGMGTIADFGAEAIAREIVAARELTDRPIAVNLLLPFARRDWFEAADRADIVVTHGGAPKRRTAGVWIHQAGSLDEARASRSAGADGVIVQGVEAGGHVRGTTPALELLAEVRAAMPHDYPLLLAGGIAERADVERALDAGADAAVAGTRFLLSDESRAHPEYTRRLLEADTTVLTELFGTGWPAPHRVIANAATEHWLRDDPRGPALTRGLNRLLAPVSRFIPASVQVRMAQAQRPSNRLLSPTTVTVDVPDTLVDAGALYAGETVARITDVRPAAELVAQLSPS